MEIELKKFEILLGVTGGIAAYKTAQLCSDLVKHHAGVTVAMTSHAQHFVAPLTFSTLTGRQVLNELFGSENIYDTQHISLTEKADLIVIAPATANIIAKMASGICDDLLSTLLCSADSDILLAPAMNSRMWLNPANARNIETLKQQGCHFVGPETGKLACDDEGIGRMSEPQQILKKIAEILKNKDPKNLSA